jgi:urease accessory protein
MVSRLAFERVGVRTVVREALAAAPLRLLTPRNHGEGAWAFTSTLGGGLVDGDRVSLHVELGAGARALLGSQGANRIYRSPRGCRSAVRAKVGAGGLLVLAPDPTACFAGARYDQSTEVELEDGASLALIEALTAGRSARGERWAARHCSTTLKIRTPGGVLIDEAWRIDPAHGAPAERFGRFEALATLLLVGPLLAEARAQARARIDEAPPARDARVVEAASPLGEGALLIRIAAATAEECSRAARVHFTGVPALLGDDPWARRF